MMAEHSRMITDPTGARQFQTILFWQHPEGQAHCLARVHFPPRGPVVAIVTEIRSNPRELGMGLDFPRLAEALLRRLPAGVSVQPAEIIWTSQFGEFSYWYEALDAPEAILRITLDWDGQHYAGDLDGHHILTPGERDELLGEILLEPVPDVVAALGWEF